MITLPTRGALAAETIPLVVAAILVCGAAVPGDIDPLAYERVADAVHPAAITSDDGAHFAPVHASKLSVLHFWKDGDSELDYLPVINRGITWLNAGRKRALEFPPANFPVSGTLDRVIAAGSRIAGAGLGLTKIIMAKGGPGCALRMGQPTPGKGKPFYMGCTGMKFEHAGDPADTDPLFECDGVIGFDFRKNSFSNGAGCWRFGWNHRVVRVYAERNEGNYDPSHGGVGATIGDFVNFKDFNNRVQPTDNIEKTDRPILWVRPALANGDTYRMWGSEYFQNGAGIGVVFDRSRQHVVHVWLIGTCVFDQAEIRCLLFTDDGKIADPVNGKDSQNKDFRNINVKGIRAKPDVNRAAEAEFDHARAIEFHTTGTGKTMGVRVVDNELGFTSREAVLLSEPPDQSTVAGLVVLNNDCIDVMPGIQSPGIVRCNVQNARIEGNRALAGVNNADGETVVNAEQFVASDLITQEFSQDGNVFMDEMAA